MVGILINNYYCDKDNLRSRTEDHVDAKCVLSTRFYDRRRSFPNYLSSCFFLNQAQRTTNEGIGGRSESLK